MPLGYLDGDSFNFIFRACVACNSEKAAAERHISTVSLFNSPARATSQDIDEIAIRKASKDFHPEKKSVLVKDAGNQTSVESSFGSTQMRFELSGPPQPSEDAIQILACRHVQGIFSLITSLDPTKSETTRLLPAERVFYFGAFPDRDWGDPQLAELSRRVSTWTCTAIIVAARGFFKAVLRRPDEKGMGWFWALEWNHCLRVVGGIGSSARDLPLFDDLPALEWQVLPDGSRRIREEIPLKEVDDNLFGLATEKDRKLPPDADRADS